jgi:pimeloyl-ACP methyl ester carboxylesterase
MVKKKSATRKKAAAQKKTASSTVNKPNKSSQKSRRAAPAAIKKKKELRMTKRMKKTIILLIALLVLSVLLLQLLSLQVKLLFDTETHIELAPSINHIDASGKTPPTINLTTSITKLAVCDVVCTFTMQDTSKDEIVQQTTSSPSGTYTEHILLPLPEFGAGQKLFNYQVNCTVSDKGICPSKGKEYAKSAFITVNYNLTQPEREREQEVKTLLTVQAETIAHLHSELLSAQAMQKQTTNSSLATPFNESLLNAVQTIKHEQSIVRELWELQDFSAAQRIAQEQQENINQLASKVQAHATIHQQEMMLYNEGIRKAQAIYEERNLLEKQSALLWQVDKQAFESLRSMNNSYYMVFSATEVFSPHEINQTAWSITKRKEEINQSYVAALAQKENLSNAVNEELIAIATQFNLSLSAANCSALDESLQLIAQTTAQLQNISINTSNIEDYNQTYCQETPTIAVFTIAPPSVLQVQEIIVSPVALPTPKDQCCFRNNCSACSGDTQIPVLLVHGHAFSQSASPELAFTRLSFLQDALTEYEFVHASTMNKWAKLDSVGTGDWGRVNRPITIGTTYYYLKYYELGQLSFTTRKADRIENYAIRLKESIDIVRRKTGSDKVIIIAHSMGGLVSRSYLQLFGEEHVEALILMGTPNHGIQGDIRRYCTVTGAKAECDDMYADSPFMQRLNEFEPVNTDMYTITAVGCPTRSDTGVQKGDGVVLANSSTLPYAENIYVNGTCTDFLQKDLHMDFVNPLIYPEITTIVAGILENYYPFVATP